jgi:diadenosine tetraphosphate (Ap4A) HIT family hydrolase
VIPASDGTVEGCDFCAIARGKDRSVQVVCESDSWIAFFPLKPATMGHTLVIPRRHLDDVWELDEALGADLMAAVIRVGRAVETAVRPEGMNLISSKGAPAEQTVFHLHLHLLPRWSRDGFDRIWPTESPYEDTDLRAVAARIRAACTGGPS